MHTPYPYHVIIGNVFELLTCGSVSAKEIPDISAMDDFAQIQQTLAPVVETALDYIQIEANETTDAIRDANREFLQNLIEAFYQEYHTSIEPVTYVDTVEDEEPGVETDKLFIGMEIKNYAAMCGLLGEEQKNGGTSKKAQEKEWRRYFDWTRAGHKYIILDIYEHPLPRDDGRKNGNRAIYVRLVETVLASFLSTCSGHTKTLTRGKWQEILGMVNERYYKYNRFNEKPFLELRGVNPEFTEWEIKHFYYRSWRKLNEILRNALNSLRSRALIEYTIQTVIVPVDEHKSWFVANDREEEELLKIRHEVLEEMDLSKEQQVYATFRQGEFFARVNEIMAERYQWRRYFRQIKIIYNLKNMQRAVSMLEAELEKLELNDRIVTTLKTDAEKYKATLDEKYRNGAGWCPPPSYLYAQAKLTDYLISLREPEDTIKYLLEHPDGEIDELFNEPLIP